MSFLHPLKFLSENVIHERGKLGGIVGFAKLISTLDLVQASP
jgi:hypothetical protein